VISLHAGRLLLVCSRFDRNWHARVILGPKLEHQLDADTGTMHLQTALIRAQKIYEAALVQLRPAGGQRMCWDCLHWDTHRNRCEMGLPESKQSGGRYAVRCEIYEPAEGDQPHRSWRRVDRDAGA
jgi:hypothetical protein